MILDTESWMNIRRFRALHDAGATYVEIGRECGVDWRTVKKYLEQPVPVTPPQAPPRAGTQPRKIAPYAAVMDGWLRADVKLKAATIHERLAAEYGWDGNYQRVKMYCAQARPRIAAELDATDENPLRGLHRRFETVAGAQAQVDWGDETTILAHAGVGKVWSFHMTLSYSRDPFCCYVDSADLGSFFDCHRRAFAHFGGVPGSIVYDRTKTVVKRHVAPGAAVPIHPEAAAFADHYGFVIDVLAAYRPTGKGRVERQVNIVRDHVLAGRSFDSLAEMDAAFAAWLPIRRSQVHRTHGEVISVRAKRDRAALVPLPAIPYLVTDRHLRRVGKDCLVSFDASLYSVPAAKIRPGQRVEVRAGREEITIHQTGGGALLAAHPRARQRGTWMVDQRHWDGLPDGHTRSTIVEGAGDPAATSTGAGQAEPNPLQALLARSSAAAIPVARRSLDVYDNLARTDHGTVTP
jgi:transposase